MRGTLFAVGPIVLAVCGLSSACGRAPDSQSKVPFWAKVAPEQIAEAKKHGVPVSFENDPDLRFALTPSRAGGTR